MITLDQVLLLQEKVESAVDKISSLTERISQLESENDALRSKCAELTKAYSEKTELVSTMESTQAKIEESILLALTRLDSVEDKLLGSRDGQGDDAMQNPAEAEIPVHGTEAGIQQEEETLPQEQEEQHSVAEPQIFSQENQPPLPAEENRSSSESADINGQFDIF